MIPRHIHQIWVGPKARPDTWMQTWRDQHPSFDYTVWDEAAIDAFGLEHRHIYEYFMHKGIYDGAADIARVEILARLGGIYIDADAVCLHPITDAPFLYPNVSFFAAYEYDYRIANGVIGVTQYHPILMLYLLRLRTAKVWEPPCFTIGGTLLTTCVDICRSRLSPSSIAVLPSYTFYPKLGHYHEAEGTIYARQMWGTTKGLYKDTA